MAALETVSGSVYSYNVIGLTNGTTYYFIVTAKNPGGYSAYSSEVSATPQVTLATAPTLQTATVGNGHVSLSWNAVNGATGYKIYQRTTSGTYEAELATVSGSVYSYDATGLANGTTYYFVVKASNAGGNSAASNEVSAVPVAPSSGGGGGSVTSSNSTGVDVLVNGKAENAGTATTTKEGDKTVTTVAVDPQKLAQKLESEGNNSIFTIPIKTQSDVVIGELNGQMG